MAQHVMVVEDEYKLKELVPSYLEREGMDVFPTGSGAEAIHYAGLAPLDLVILDLGLPDIPGEEVAREIRSVSDVPILMLSPRAPAERGQAGITAGDFIIAIHNQKVTSLAAPQPPGRRHLRHRRDRHRHQPERRHQDHHRHNQSARRLETAVIGELR